MTLTARIERLERMAPRSGVCRIDAPRVIDALAALMPAGNQRRTPEHTQLIALGGRIDADAMTDADRALLAAIPADALGGVNPAELVAGIAQRVGRGFVLDRQGSPI